MESPRIDLDAEALWFEGRWFTKEELAGEIKARLEAGNFAVAALSGALEQLVKAVSGARVVAFRLEAELADALNVQAQRQGVSAGALLRQAVRTVLTQAPAYAEVRPLRPAPQTPAPTRSQTAPTEDPVEAGWFGKQT